MASLDINPCIFVGIGSTGLKILEELRRLIYEEFGVGGMPCFRYIVLETNREAQVNDNFLPHAPGVFEQIKLIPINVPALNAVHVEPGSSLDKWLDKRTLEFAHQAYENGAGLHRQAGRLCLWENWRTVSSVFIRAIEEIRAHGNLTATDQFLRTQYFQNKRTELPVPEESLVSPVPRIYIVGTLCGGTCSGTFTDIAYWFQQQMHARHHSELLKAGNPEIIGIFTIPDINQTQTHTQQRSNSWAALIELDYYSKSPTNYDLPSGEQIKNAEAPFSTVYLESRKNQGQCVFSEADADGLHQMCAMNLFTEVVAGLAAVKAANRMNLPAAGEGYLRCNSSGHLQFFHSFGLSAIWYPRYRIAKAITRRLGQEMSDCWLGESRVNAVRIEETSRADLQAVLNEAGGSLLGTVANAHCTEPLPNRIVDLFDRRRTEFRAVDQAGLEDYLLNFPTDDATLAQRLNPNGDYYRIILNAEPLVTRDAQAAIEALVVKYLRNHTLSETKSYVRNLLTKAEESERQIPEELPFFSPWPSLTIQSQVFGDMPSWLLGMRAAAIDEYKDTLWTEFKDRALDYLTSLQQHFLRRVVHGVVAHLQRTLARIETIELRLQSLKHACIREKDEQTKFRPPSNIIVISSGPQRSIPEDVEIAAAEILNSVDPIRLRETFFEGQDLLLLFERSEKELLDMMDQKYRPYVQPLVNNFRIEERTLQGLNNQIRDLVYAAAPYFEPDDNWRPMRPPEAPNFLFCSDHIHGAELLNHVAHHLRQDARIELKPMLLDHFVIIYQETPGLAINNLRIAERAKSDLEREEEARRDHEPTHFTHKGGRKMFDHNSVLWDARQWIKDARALAPEQFHVTEQGACIEYQSPDGLHHTLFVDREERVRAFLQQYGLEELEQIFLKFLAKSGREVLVRRMEQRRAEVQDPKLRRELEERHSEILKKLDEGGFWEGPSGGLSNGAPSSPSNPNGGSSQNGDHNGQGQEKIEFPKIRIANSKKGKKKNKKFPT